MNTYSLVALFLLTGGQYIERDGLSLQGCAGHAAIARQEMLAVQEQLEALVGEVRYLCLPERSLARVSREVSHGLEAGQ
jgi:hypothetical protein